MGKGGPTERQKKLAERKKKLQQYYVNKAQKLSPPKPDDEFMAQIDDLSSRNVNTLSCPFSVNPDTWLCALPCNVNLYRGCSNGCSYCFSNLFSRCRIARAPGLTQRSFYAAAKDLAPLEKALQLSQGRRRLEEFPKGERFYAWFFSQRFPVCLSTSTDPFMALERKYRYSSQALRLFQGYDYPLVISTKGGDIFDQYLNQIIGLPQVIVQISLISVDDEVVADYEPNSPPASQRLAAIKKLTDAGVYVSVRWRPIIPDSRIINIDHIERFCGAIAVAGVKFVELNALKLSLLSIRINNSTENSNEALRQAISKLTNADFARSDRFSISTSESIEFGSMAVPILQKYGLQYSHHWLNFGEFHSDLCSACHCANLEEAGGPFKNYFKATFSQLLLDAKRLYEKTKLPVLLERPDLDRYPYPPDDLIFPSRRTEEQLPYRELLNILWRDIDAWFWLPAYIRLWVGGSDLKWAYDTQYGLCTYYYYPFGHDRDFTAEDVEQNRASLPERVFIRLNGEKMPFPDEIEQQHPFWRKREVFYKKFA